MVEYFPIGTDFPMKLSISESGHYSVAVFGWSDGVIECLPVISKQVDLMQGNNVHTNADSVESDIHTPQPRTFHASAHVVHYTYKSH